MIPQAGKVLPARLAGNTGIGNVTKRGPVRLISSNPKHIVDCTPIAPVIDLTGVGQGSINIEDNQMHMRIFVCLAVRETYEFISTAAGVHFVTLLAALSERVSEA